MLSSPSSIKAFVIAAKIYAGAVIKVCSSCPILLDLCTLFLIYYPWLCRHFCHVSSRQNSLQILIIMPQAKENYSSHQAAFFLSFWSFIKRKNIVINIRCVMLFPRYWSKIGCGAVKKQMRNLVFPHSILSTSSLYL